MKALPVPVKVPAKRLKDAVAFYLATVTERRAIAPPPWKAVEAVCGKVAIIAPRDER